MREFVTTRTWDCMRVFVVVPYRANRATTEVNNLNQAMYSLYF